MKSPKLPNVSSIDGLSPSCTESVSTNVPPGLSTRAISLATASCVSPASSWNKYTLYTTSMLASATSNASALVCKNVTPFPSTPASDSVGARICFQYFMLPRASSK